MSIRRNIHLGKPNVRVNVLGEMGPQPPAGGVAADVLAAAVGGVTHRQANIDAILTPG